MKTLQFEEIDLVGKSIYDKNNYSSYGLFIVNDGIAYYIVNVPEDNGMGILSCPIPKEIFEQEIKENVAETIKLDIKGVIEQKFDALDSKIEEMGKFTPETVVSSPSSPFVGVSEDSLVKIIGMLTGKM